MSGSSRPLTDKRTVVGFCRVNADLSKKRRNFSRGKCWAIRIRLEIAKNIRELAMLNMAIDCKLRSCELAKLLVRDISRNGEVLDRTQVIQQKTSQPAQFEITKKTRESVEAWIELHGLSGMDYCGRAGCKSLTVSLLINTPVVSKSGLPALDLILQYTQPIQ